MADWFEVTENVVRWKNLHFTKNYYYDELSGEDFMGLAVSTLLLPTLRHKHDFTMNWKPEFSSDITFSDAWYRNRFGSVILCAEMLQWLDKDKVDCWVICINRSSNCALLVKSYYHAYFSGGRRVSSQSSAEWSLIPAVGYVFDVKHFHYEHRLELPTYELQNAVHQAKYRDHVSVYLHHKTISIKSTSKYFFRCAGLLTECCFSTPSPRLPSCSDSGQYGLSRFAYRRLSDFCLLCHCDDHTSYFYCNKFVLASRSPVFEAMLSMDSMETQNNECHVYFQDGCSCKVMQKFVHIIYHGCLQYSQCVAYFEALELANKYMVINRDLIEAFQEHVSNSNIVRLTRLAWLHGHTRMEALSFHYIFSNLASVVQICNIITEGLPRDMTRDLVELLICNNHESQAGEIVCNDNSKFNE